MTQVNPQVAFPTLTPEQIDRLHPYGTVRPVGAGDILFQEGDTAYDCFVLVVDCGAARPPIFE
jgi:hypothetical protein